MTRTSGRAANAGFASIDATPLYCVEAREKEDLCGPSGTEWQINESMLPPKVDSITVDEAKEIFEKEKSNE